MRMNANIPLAGRPANILGAIQSGTQMADEANTVRQRNALRGFLQENGGAVLAGDQQALAGYAGFDPAAAQGIQAGRQSMDLAQQQNRRAEGQFRILEAQEASAVAQQASQMTAAERAAAQAEVKRAIRMGTAIDDPETWDNVMRREAPELVGRFDERDMLVRGFMDLGDIIKMDAAPEPADEYGRYVAEERAAGRQPLSRIGYAQAKRSERVVFGPEGNPIIAEGPAGTATRLTEAQSKDNVYATRAAGAQESLEPVAAELASRAALALDLVPFGFGRDLQSQEYQTAQVAGQEFLQAILRKDTGAAITAQEQELYGNTFLPQPGDGPAVLAARREARYRAVEAMRAAMSLEQVAQTEQALIRAKQATEETNARLDPPAVGDVVDGYTFQGGNPADPNSWTRN